jgi:hypothetical protein
MNAMQILRQSPILFALFLPMLLLDARPARAQDIDLCFATADRVANGENVPAEDKQAGHQACQRALADSASIVQKYQIQEADFDITGRPKKPD